jgi:hypothetical protein
VFAVSQLYQDKLQALKFFKINQLENSCYEERKASGDRNRSLYACSR